MSTNNSFYSMARAMAMGDVDDFRTSAWRAILQERLKRALPRLLRRAKHLGLSCVIIRDDRMILNQIVEWSDACMLARLIGGPWTPHRADPDMRDWKTEILLVGPVELYEVIAGVYKL